MREATISLNIGTVAVPELITLARINQDNYSSEYRLKGTDVVHTLFIRHSKEKAKQLGRVIERHNVTYSQRWAPTDINPQGREIQVYSVLRNSADDPTTDITPMVNALCNLTVAEVDGILNWES